VLAGDNRLASRLQEAELLPIASRIRARLRTEALDPSQLLQCVNHLLKMAGNPKLMSPSLLQTLCEHAAGNLRLLMNMANDLLPLHLSRNVNRLMKSSSSRFLLWIPNRLPNVHEPTACPTRQ
jgi:general secretion pathway protein A